MWMNARVIALDIHCNDFDHHVFRYSRQMLTPYPQETVAHFSRRLFSLCLVLPWLHHRQAQQRLQHSSATSICLAANYAAAECNDLWQLQMANTWPSHLQPDFAIGQLAYGEYLPNYWIAVDMPSSPRLKQLQHRHQQSLVLSVTQDAAAQGLSYESTSETAVDGRDGNADLNHRKITRRHYANDLPDSHQVSIVQSHRRPLKDAHLDNTSANNKAHWNALTHEMACASDSVVKIPTAHVQPCQGYSVYQISDHVLTQLSQCIERRMQVLITQQDAELDICIGDCQLHVPALDHCFA